LVLKSATTIFFPVAVGAPGVREIAPPPELAVSTTKFVKFEIAPPGFVIHTKRFPADCKSPADSEVVHSVLSGQIVVRAVPATKMIDRGPGLDAAKLLPATASVNPPADPAFALNGASDAINGPVEMVTVADAVWLVSIRLVATTLMRLGDGANAGAVYIPKASTDPHAPGTPHAAPVTFHRTCWFPEPSTLAENDCCAPFGTVTLPGKTLTNRCGRIVTLEELRALPSARLVAVMLTGFGNGIPAGAR
jgi:hypothetical protein